MDLRLISLLWILYLAFAFVTNEFDFTAWHVAVRFFFVIVLLFCGMYITEEYREDKQ
jgi:predicted small integral membrane protein